ncbi:MAG: hypothetical protein H0X41_05265 [Chitinophagaceae bacterium]|nr:hypothetical protein [Chitinophagaceae bacterium]
MYRIRIINNTGQQVNEVSVTHSGTGSVYKIPFLHAMRKGIYMFVVTGPDKYRPS